MLSLLSNLITSVLYLGFTEPQSWENIVATKFEDCSFKTLYFLNLKGYEIHLFRLARLQPPAMLYPFLLHHQYWIVLGKEENNSMILITRLLLMSEREREI